MPQQDALPPFRFIRVNPRVDQHETLTKLKIEVNCDPFPIEVPWLKEYYALPQDFSLNNSPLFKSAHIYGQDVSSGAAVAVLLSDHYDIVTKQETTTKQNIELEANDLRILDLCCCPGLKLCAIADTLYRQEKCGDIVGVDISESRMATCQRIIHKYQIQKFEDSDSSRTNSSSRIRLLCNDGSKLHLLSKNELNLIFDSIVATDEEISRKGKRKRMNKSARIRNNKLLKNSALIDGVGLDTESGTNDTKIRLFDRVLVDAECSTDGSIVHVQKRSQKSQVLPRWSNENQYHELCSLQRKLASSGFQLLRKGGYMVYSTCSLSSQQNDDIVQWVLDEFSDAKIVPIHFPNNSSIGSQQGGRNLVQEGKIPGTVQFLPNLTTGDEVDNLNCLYGGGFYVAKIQKV